MALWGKTDDLAGTPKYVARTAAFLTADVTGNTINISGSGTGFNTGDQVVATGAASGTYFVRVIDAGVVSLYPSYADAVANTSVVTLSAADGSIQGTGRVGDITAGGDQIIFVDAAEAQVEANKAKGLTGAGWWRYQTYTDAQTNVRHKAECLVSMAVSAAAAGDAEDVIAEDLVITFDTDLAASTNVTAPNPFTLTVATSTNGDAIVAYQWYVNDGGGFDPIVGETGASLTVADSSGLNGYIYQVTASAGGVTATSTSTTLTVS
jgi:hypothetical protein